MFLSSLPTGLGLRALPSLLLGKARFARRLARLGCLCGFLLFAGWGRAETPALYEYAVMSYDGADGSYSFNFAGQQWRSRDYTKFVGQLMAAKALPSAAYESLDRDTDLRNVLKRAGWKFVAVHQSSRLVLTTFYLKRAKNALPAGREPLNTAAAKAVVVHQE